MSLIDITAVSSVKNVAPVTSKTITWQGAGAYTLTLDPQAVTAIEPYRDYADAGAPEGPVPGFFTVTLSAGQHYVVDATARGQIVAAKNAMA